jgi:tRNA U38,U39,U40 pseudouridine synthase TruA
VIKSLTCFDLAKALTRSVCVPSNLQDTGVHALANTCHVDVERRSKRRPGEVVIA